ncbi:protein giant-like protein [Dinothrombium tinctorium]|uniref:Protein giant-like protein n=1 Tax=Dinothrombium tinctorium TaxID=1965070 RepID=A0A443QBY6_9ACAR|nr:protein giant-like protein [Dinothrombium tinctorium]
MSIDRRLSFYREISAEPYENSPSSSKEIYRVVVNQPLDLSFKKRLIKKKASDATNVQEPTNYNPVANCTTHLSSKTRRKFELIENKLALIDEKINAIWSPLPEVNNSFGIGDLRNTTMTPTSTVIQFASKNEANVSNDMTNCRHNILRMSSIGMEQNHEALNPSPLNQANGVYHFTTPGVSMFTTSAFLSSDPHKHLKYIPQSPFKISAYSRESILPINNSNANLNSSQLRQLVDEIVTRSLNDVASDEEYRQFRERMLVARKQDAERRRKPNSSASQSPDNCQETSKSPNAPDSSDTECNDLTDSELEQSNFNSNDNPSRMSHEATSPNAKLKRRIKRNDSNTTQSAQGTSTRKKAKHFTDSKKDNAYRERRKKNNEAAKRSRDRKRAKENEVEVRAAWLAQKNVALKVQISKQTEEIENLRSAVYQ